MPIVSPFHHSGPRSQPMAAWIGLALLVPCSIYSYLYEPTFLLRLFGYALLGMMAETIFTLVFKRKKRLVCTGSGLTAALLAASVPASMPFLSMLYAILIAVWIVKLPMTGLPLRLNATMAGRLFLMLVYPNEIVNWGTPSADVISCATPQELYRTEGFPLEYSQLLFGKIEGVWEELFLLVPGSPGETFPVLLFLIGLLLFWKKIACWRAPLAFLLSFSITSAFFGNSPIYNLFSAATIFSALFIVSDPVSTPMSISGKVLCGIIIGVSNGLIRNYTYYTEAIVYAVLIGNLAAPLLDWFAFNAQGLRLKRRMKA